MISVLLNPLNKLCIKYQTLDIEFLVIWLALYPRYNNNNNDDDDDDDDNNNKILYSAVS